MKKKSAKIDGKMLFIDYYSSYFGERWENIEKSFANASDYRIIRNESGEEYFIDAASVVAAAALPLENAENILDLCAAPGGKSLVLADRMPENALLVSNEKSKNRYCRLKKVLQDFLPESVFQRITVTNHDAAKWCRYEGECEKYDAVLIDAPCSSEKHVYNDEAYLKLWTPARIRNLAMVQWSILSSGFLLLKQNGYLVYSTCALTDAENDAVVARLLKKYKSASVVEFNAPDVNLSHRPELYSNLPHPEKTEYGYQIMPDLCNNSGPIYFSIIKKN